MNKIRKAIALFDLYVKRGDECWGWNGGNIFSGYPYIRFGPRGKQVRFKASRISWMLYKGEIPGKLLVLHHCDNRICTNPEHLFLGTQRDNVDDMISKKRAFFQKEPERIKRKGSDHGNSKLSENDIKEIRRLRASGLRQWEIAKRFGITRGNVGHIVRRLAWKHVA